MRMTMTVVAVSGGIGRYNRPCKNSERDDSKNEITKLHEYLLHRLFPLRNSPAVFEAYAVPRPDIHPAKWKTLK
jgi:hypothetical protein